MSRENRKNVIEQIEQARGSRVLAYATSDRQPSAASAQISDDAVRELYAHLREIGHVDKLDLVIYSRGGAIDVPWRIVTALRQTSEEWNLLVPFRANSAATLLGLGADKIILGRQGELGPIDPQMNIQKMIQQPGGGHAVVQDIISVEDVMAYTKFVHDRAGLSDQDALAGALGKLTDRLDAVGIGNAYRTHLHIRDVALRMLQSRKTPMPERTMGAIIEALAERVYAHGHAIGLTEAEAIGLPVESASDDLDGLMWQLLTEYEDDMKLLQPIDAIDAIGSDDVYREDQTAAVIESTWAAHELQGQVEVRAKRQHPTNLNVALTMNVQVPQNFNPQHQGALQQLLQQLQQQVAQDAQQALQQALKEQAPLIGADVAFRGGKWVKLA